MRKLMLAFFLLLTGAVTAVDAQPAIYTVQGRHNVLHLVGTVHLLQQSDVLPDNINHAYADSKQLLMEVDTSAMDPLAVQESMMSSGMLPDDKTLETELDAATYSRLKSVVEEAGLQMAMLNHMRPWLVGLTLEETMFAKMGFDPNAGVEMQLTQLAAKDHKPISGFETMDEQIGFFSRLDEKTEIDYLASTLDEFKDMRSELDELVNAWRRGDEDKLQSLLQKEVGGHEKFFNVLIYERNRRWVARLTSLLDNSSDNYLVAVGALHLVGDNGLVSLLRKAGYKVTRD
ncbi:MAG TPA: TraB/GumN family protein [Steroidobacteraceae bacterium]|nr:TraB/GumN family protein [Steroidobacteraceae bacterium]